jgi:hypothetical protein
LRELLSDLRVRREKRRGGGVSYENEFSRREGLEETLERLGASVQHRLQGEREQVSYS